MPRHLTDNAVKKALIDEAAGILGTAPEFVTTLKTGDYSLVQRFTTRSGKSVIGKISAGPLKRELSAYAAFGKTLWAPCLLTSRFLDGHRALLIMEDLPGPLLRDVKDDLNGHLVLVLAALFKLQDKIASKPSVINRYCRDVGASKDWLDTAAEIAQDFSVKIPAPYFDRPLCLRALHAVATVLKDEPLVLAHGDLYGDAIILANSRRTCFLDWGFARIAPAVMDQATVLQNHARKNGFDDLGLERTLRLYVEACTKSSMPITENTAYQRLLCGWFLSDLFFLEWIAFLIQEKRWTSGIEGIYPFVEQLMKRAQTVLAELDG